jgi:hypothetical protein
MYDIFWDDEWGTLKFQYVENKVFAHAIAKQWNKKVYLKFLDIWHVAKEELKEAGYNEIYVVIPDNDKKLFKFEVMFGFRVLHQVDGLLVMICSTEN